LQVNLPQQGLKCNTVTNLNLSRNKVTSFHSHPITDKRFGNEGGIKLAEALKANISHGTLSQL
jgi:hypothetical protein